MHLTIDNLKKSRNQGDSLADGLIADQNHLLQAKEFLRQCRTNQDINTDDLPLSLIPLVHDINQYQLEMQKSPSLAQQLYQSRISDILGLMGLYSLPYCYAAAKGARVLIHSKKIIENPQIRLLETARFVHDVCSPGAFDPQGVALISILKVRILHAYIRQHATKFIKDEVPVNQMDMAGTNLSFSLIVIRGMRKFGVDLSQKQEQAWLAYWSVIGKMLGISPQLSPAGIREVTWLERQIRKLEFKPCKEGKQLATALLSYIDSQPIPLRGFKVSDIMAALLGEEVAQILGIPYNQASSNLLLSGIKFSNLIPSIYQFPEQELRTRLNDIEQMQAADLFLVPVQANP